MTSSSLVSKQNCPSSEKFLQHIPQRVEIEFRNSSEIFKFLNFYFEHLEKTRSLWQV